MTPITFENLEECFLDKATLITINNRWFSQDEFSIKHNWLGDQKYTIKGVSVRTTLDNWSDFNIEDFELINLKCYKKKEHKPVSFKADIQEHSIRECDNHGMNSIKIGRAHV